MTSEKQILANRRNGQKSTGPRTELGKDKASANSIKHGLLCKDVLLPQEEPDELEELYQPLRAQLQPEGALEELMFERIVACAWRLRRLGRVEAGLFVRTQSLLEAQRAGRVINDREPQMIQEYPGKVVITKTTITENDRERMRREEAATPPEVKAARELEKETARAVRKQAMQRLEEGDGLLGEVFAKDAGNRDAFTKLSRYETAMERGLSRALHELQRLQAERAGKPVLPPMVVDVNLSTD
jgi:hypothetical protein